MAPIIRPVKSRAAPSCCKTTAITAWVPIKQIKLNSIKFNSFIKAFKHKMSCTCITRIIMPTQPDSTPNLKHLEQEGERKVAELINKNAVTEDALMGIINEGNDAFKNAHGRNMTYAEMRSMYG